jgi:acyl-CoA dehydrogenase
MIDFSLTHEQHVLAHDFATKEIRPVAWEYDRDGRVVTYPGG